MPQSSNVSLWCLVCSILMLRSVGKSVFGGPQTASGEMRVDEGNKSLLPVATVYAL